MNCATWPRMRGDCALFRIKSVRWGLSDGSALDQPHVMCGTDFRTWGPWKLIFSGVARACPPTRSPKLRNKMEKNWGKMIENLGEWRKIEEMLLSCPPRVKSLTTPLQILLWKQDLLILSLMGSCELKFCESFKHLDQKWSQIALLGLKLSFFCYVLFFVCFVMFCFLFFVFVCLFLFCFVLFCFVCFFLFWSELLSKLSIYTLKSKWSING